MNVSLTPEEQAIVTRLVASGRYSSEKAVLNAALVLLEEDETQTDALREEVEKGLDALARGDFTEYDQEGLKNLATEIKARGRENLERIDNNRA